MSMLNRLRRVTAVAIKEIRQLTRDRLSLGMIVGIPLMQILLFGFAINMDIRNLPASVLDLSGTKQSRELIAAAAQSQVVQITARATDSQQLERQIRRGEIAVGLLIPADYVRRLHAGEEAAQLWVDGSDPQILASAQRLASMPHPISPNAIAAPFNVRAFFNPERRTAVFIVPGLLGVVLTMTMIMFTAMAIVRERERGNMELLITTPVKSSELMLGKILPYVVIGLIQVSLILIVARLVFAVPLNGSLIELYLASLVFIAASLSLGLLISTKAQTQFQSMQLTFFVFLPSILLSGFMFPFQGMPKIVQWLAEILPLTHFLRIVRGILLRGAGLSELVQELLALTAFFVVAMIIAALRFEKTLD